MLCQQFMLWNLKLENKEMKLGSCLPDYYKKLSAQWDKPWSSQNLTLDDIKSVILGMIWADKGSWI